MRKIQGLNKIAVLSVLLIACIASSACMEKLLQEKTRTVPQAQAIQVTSQKDDKKIDLNLTREYVREWAARKAFPETVPFAYYCAYSLKTLDKKISPETSKKIADYLKKCQTKNGGFVTEPEFSKTPDLLATYFALRTLALLDARKSIDQQKAVQFVLSLYQDNGSFKSDQKRDYSSLATTYYGVTCLHVLKALDQINKDQILPYIKSHREKGLGFSVQRNGISRPLSTYMAVRSLKLLGAFDEKIKLDLVNYLKGTRYAGYVEDKRFTVQPTLRECSFVLLALSDLNAVNKVKEDKVYGFIESLYVPGNGGFGPKPSYGTTPPSIYEGIVSLEKLGKLKDFK
jgi:prenyltransferase beta subunit